MAQPRYNSGHAAAAAHARDGPTAANTDGDRHRSAALIFVETSCCGRRVGARSGVRRRWSAPGCAPLSRCSLVAEVDQPAAQPSYQRRSRRQPVERVRTVGTRAGPGGRRRRVAPRCASVAALPKREHSPAERMRTPRTGDHERRTSSHSGVFGEARLSLGSLLAAAKRSYRTAARRCIVAVATLGIPRKRAAVAEPAGACPPPPRLGRAMTPTTEDLDGRPEPLLRVEKVPFSS